MPRASFGRERRRFDVTTLWLPSRVRSRAIHMWCTIQCKPKYLCRNSLQSLPEWQQNEHKHCIDKRLDKRPRVILEVYVCLALASWEEMAPSQRRLSQRTCNVVMSAMVSRKASHVPIFVLLPKIRAFSRGSGLELKVVSQVLVEGCGMKYTEPDSHRYNLKSTSKYSFVRVKSSRLTTKSHEVLYLEPR